jgi:hypothetical protein
MLCPEFDWPLLLLTKPFDNKLRRIIHTPNSNVCRYAGFTTGHRFLVLFLKEKQSLLFKHKKNNKKLQNKS